MYHMQITTSIHAIRHVFRIPISPGVALNRFVYSFLIFGDTITLIDTGVAGCEKDIFTCIRKNAVIKKNMSGFSVQLLQ